MTDTKMQELSDTDLDAAAGGASDSKHKDWIIIESMSSPIHRNTGTSTQGNEYTTWRVEEGEA